MRDPSLGADVEGPWATVWDMLYGSRRMLAAEWQRELRENDEDEGRIKAKLQSYDQSRLVTRERRH